MEIVRTKFGLVDHYENNQGKRLVKGQAAVWYSGDPGTEYEIKPNVFERIARTAFDSALQSPEILALFNHENNKVLARTSSGTLKLYTSSTGLNYEIELNRSSYANDLWENLQSGNIKGSSFSGFVSDRNDGGYDIQRQGDKQIITINKLASLREVSPCFDPAYTGTDSQAIQRAIKEWNAEQETKRRIDIFRNRYIP